MLRLHYIGGKVFGTFAAAGGILFLCPAGLSANQHYEASLEKAEWKLNASAVKCELVHPIPSYGEAIFIHSSGGELAFKLQVDQPPVSDSVALLYSAPPFWKPGIVKRELSRSPLLKGSTPVYFTRPVALRMLYELEQGMQPMLFYRDWADASEDVTVAVSTVNFRNVWPDFTRCESQLLTFGFDDVKNTSIMFDSGSAALKKDARDMLDRIADYIKNDKAVNKVLISGHTDSIGFKYLNELLSQRRAKTVKKYLLSRNVDSRKISILAYGESHPKVSNASATGRKFNRRVQVQLIR